MGILKRKETREEVAEMLAYNGDYINRVFKKQTGRSILNYCQTVRMEEAARLLSTTPLVLHPARNETDSTAYFAICRVVVSQRRGPRRFLPPPGRLTKYSALSVSFLVGWSTRCTNNN